MKKNLLPAIIGIALLASVALYFSTPPKLPSHSPPPATMEQISLYHYFSGTLSGGLNEMIATVNSRDPQKKVVAHALDHEAFKSMIHETLSQGSPPELFSYWAGARVQNLVDQEQLEPIDDLWDNASFDRLFPQSIRDAACTYNGKKYLLPITQYVVVFFYNKQIFARENLQPPATWQDFIALCERLTGKGITPIALGAKERWPAQFWFDYLLLRTAGPKYRTSLMEGKRSYSEPEVVNAYATWAALLQKNFFNYDANNLDWAEATQLVCQEKAAMTLMGNWAIQMFADKSCGSVPEKDYDFFAFPTMDPAVPPVAVGPIDGIVLTHKSENHAFAKSVLAYLAETEPQKKMSEGSGALSPSLQVPTEFYSPLKQRLLQVATSAQHWAFNYDLATPPPVAEKGMDSFTELIAFPDQYKAILENLQSEIDTLAAKQ